MDLLNWCRLLAVIALTLISINDAFDCDLGNPPVKTEKEEPATPLLSKKDFAMAGLTALFSNVPGGSVLFFLLDRFLSNQQKSPWDQVKDKVKALIKREISKERVNQMCAQLTTYRKKVIGCRSHNDIALRDCLFNLMNEVANEDAKFRASLAEDKALTLGPYTIYSVISLCIGKAFMKQNAKFPKKGANPLGLLQLRSKEYSHYVNESIDKVKKWRQSLIGYGQFRAQLIFIEFNAGSPIKIASATTSTTSEPTQTEEEEAANFNPEASNHTEVNVGDEFIISEENTIDEQGAAPEVRGLDGDNGNDGRDDDNIGSLSKKGQGGTTHRLTTSTGKSTTKYWLRLIVKDGLTDVVIFDKWDFEYGSIVGTKQKLISAARVVVGQKKTEAASELDAMYKKHIKSITDQYWRIYDRDDFGNIDAETINKKWLQSTEGTAEVRGENQLNEKAVL